MRPLKSDDIYILQDTHTKKNQRQRHTFAYIYIYM